MSRREIVALVSRAIAIITLTMALLDLFISLPYQVWLLFYQHSFSDPYLFSHFSISASQWAAFIVSNVRMIALFVVAGLFWRCGPTVERLFLPAETPQ